jgi:5-methylcytosine-specific restriction endonuclease McrBC GTP-binding regulatory subunit McrB
MDETTHAFSPKVLDRAFTIELSDVDFLGYQLLAEAVGPHVAVDQKQKLLDDFTRYDPITGTRDFAQIKKHEVADIVAQYPEIRRYLDSLNKLLQFHRFHFGYRVFDEIAQFLYNNHMNGSLDFTSAFDQVVFMKILPKFSGSRARLQAPLLCVLAWALDPENPAQSLNSVQNSFVELDFGNVTAVAVFTEAALFKTVAARTLQMLLTLENDGFVSFG